MKLFQRSYHCQGEHGNCVAQQKRGHNMHDAAKPWKLKLHKSSTALQ